jgi:hypothetical protein
MPSSWTAYHDNGHESAQPMRWSTSSGAAECALLSARADDSCEQIDHIFTAREGHTQASEANQIGGTARCGYAEDRAQNVNRSGVHHESRVPNTSGLV